VKRQRKVRKRFICGLDIGTFKICATCGTIDGSGKIDILGKQIFPSQGIRSGKIKDSQKLSACIKETIKKLRKLCGLKIPRAYVNIESPDLRAKKCEEKLVFNEPTKITKFHISRLVNSAISSNVSSDRKTIEVGFRNFTLDNRIKSFYPEGYVAREIRLNIAIISAFIPTLKSFIKSIRDAGLIVEGIVPSGCAQVLGLFRNCQLNPYKQQFKKEDNEKNDILIDVGCEFTRIYLLCGQLVKDMIILSQGAQSVTEDIVTKLKLSFNCAEEVKIKYGQVNCDNRLSAKKIITKDGHVTKVLQFRQLYEIITLRVDHFWQRIKKALMEFNYADEQCGDIVVTGGGSIMEGFLERAEKTLHRSVKMGFLSAVKDNHIQTQSAFYTTSIGLIQYGFKKRMDRSPFGKVKFNPFMSMFNKVSDLYHEYF
jgi:cell division protein FtsA